MILGIQFPYDDVREVVSDSVLTKMTLNLYNLPIHQYYSYTCSEFGIYFTGIVITATKIMLRLFIIESSLIRVSISSICPVYLETIQLNLLYQTILKIKDILLYKISISIIN